MHITHHMNSDQIFCGAVLTVLPLLFIRIHLRKNTNTAASCGLACTPLLFLCMPRTTCHELHATHFTPRTTRLALHATHYTPSISRHALRATHYTPRITRHALHATHYTPRTTRHALQATHYTSRITRHTVYSS